MPKSTRKARRCKKCLNRPLLSQCCHSKAGRQYLATNEPDLPQLSEHGHNDVNVDAVFSSTIDEMLLLTSENQSNPAVPIVHSSTSFPVTPLHHSPPPAHHAESVTPGARADISGSNDGSTPDIVIATPASPTNNLSAAPSVNCFGVVEGVKRGNDNYYIDRTRPLPKTTIKETTAATRRFHCEMKNILMRCERLAFETGCWLYISGQHATANLGFINYASPWLHREGKEQLLNIQNCFNCMYSSLLDARRQEALQLSLITQKVKEDLQTAEAELAVRTTLISERDAHIAHLMSQLEVQGLRMEGRAT